LRLSESGIPNFEELSERLMKLTGWQVVAVPGLVPDDVFFDHMANRRFVAGNFIRRPDQLDYIQEPDVFHDVFGHVPMLADPVFADYLEA
ncbi:phenylalanine 4-monooxygenase, partial [Escherichia coli]|nr:phenylalanine 4-monooxygenase [Escherichia coli]